MSEPGATADAVCVELRRELREGLAPLVAEALQRLDAELLQRASRAGSAVEERRLFEALRAVRRQREGIAREFALRVGGALLPVQPGVRRPSRAGPLSLYARDELEEKLAVEALASSVAARHQEVLHGLRLRLPSLLGVSVERDEDDPLGPLSIVDAYRESLLALDIDSDLRILGLQSLQPLLLGALGALYAKFLARLDAAGFCAPVPMPGATRGDVDPASGRDRDEEPIGDADLAMLHRLMQARRARSAPPPAAALRGQRPTRPLSRERLLESIRALMQSTTALPGERPLQALRRSLAAGGVAPDGDEAVAIDLVDALFERIDRDGDFAPAARALLRGFELPFLRAALVDPLVIEQPGHPAQQLIDEFGEVAVGWCPSADPGQRLRRQVSMIVERLVAGPAAQAGGFDEALATLREFVDAQRSLADQAELREIESSRSRESLRQAQGEAALALETRMRGLRPSGWMRELLGRHWFGYLVLVLLRHGPVSDDYREALQFVEQMLAGERDAANPFHAASFRARRRELESQLRRGLATLAYTDEEILRLCSELQAFILAGCRRADPGAETGGAMLPFEDQPRQEAIDPAVMRHVRGLRPGTWFELRAERDEPERGKLIWVSPQSGRWLLVNWAGRKVADLPPEDMAAYIERGIARTVSDARLVQRATAAVMAELQGASIARRDDAGSA